MFSFKTAPVMILASFLLVSCASKHNIMKGSVALKVSDTKGIACLYGEDPQVGDKLVLYANKCEEVARGSTISGMSCKMVKSGEASINRLVNDHYAEFETTSPVSFKEGYTVEIKR